MDEKLTGIAVTKEKTNVFTDAHTFEAFIHQWAFFADRYKADLQRTLSFNLVNEPLPLPSEAELAEMKKHGPVKTKDLFNPDLLQRHAKAYTRLAKTSADVIRAHDPKRLVVTDGYPGAGAPIPDLVGTGMLQSCHTYNPIQLTHHQCEWVRGILTGNEPLPTWPLKDDKGKVDLRPANARDAFSSLGRARCPRRSHSLRRDGMLQAHSAGCCVGLV